VGLDLLSSREERLMKKTLCVLFALAGVGSLQPALAADGEAIFKSKPCVACHAVDTKMMGPAFKDVAAKYADQADAKDVLTASIKGGSTGKWGPIPMPPNAVTDEEVATLVEWILSQK